MFALVGGYLFDHNGFAIGHIILISTQSLSLHEHIKLLFYCPWMGIDNPIIILGTELQWYANAS